MQTGAPIFRLSSYTILDRLLGGCKPRFVAPVHCPAYKPGLNQYTHALAQRRSAHAQLLGNQRATHAPSSARSPSTCGGNARAGRAATGAMQVRAFDLAETLPGQGTIGLELEADAPDVDSLMVAAGGGGLIGGIAASYAG